MSPVPARRAGDPRADEVLVRHRALFGDRGEPVPVESIAEDLLGLRVVVRRGLGVSGALLPAARTVMLDAGERAARRRFTLAHEIGHWVCQCANGETRPIFCRQAHPGPQEAADRWEREANNFAAALVMPEAVVRRWWAFRPDPGELAARLGVSPEAMLWRLYNLGIRSTPPA
jgi:hypothetical protein